MGDEKLKIDLEIADEIHLTVATTPDSAYRHVKATDAWSLLDGLLEDLRRGARGKGMVRMMHVASLELAESTLDELATALYKELEDRGLDLLSAFPD